MDATQFGESDYITAEIVKASPTKKAVITGKPKSEETDWGMKLSIPVDIDKKPKTYRPNKDSVRNIIEVFGKETDNWVGKELHLSVVSVMGKDGVLALCKK